MLRPKVVCGMFGVMYGPDYDELARKTVLHIPTMYALFSRRFFHSRKNARLLQWLFSSLIGPLFRETPETTKAKSGQCKLTAKGPPFIFYFFKVTYKTGRH